MLEDRGHARLRERGCKCFPSGTLQVARELAFVPRVLGRPQAGRVLLRCRTQGVPEGDKNQVFWRRSSRSSPARAPSSTHATRGPTSRPRTTRRRSARAMADTSTAHAVGVLLLCRATRRPPRRRGDVSAWSTRVADGDHGGHRITLEQTSERHGPRFTGRCPPRHGCVATLTSSTGTAITIR